MDNREMNFNIEYFEDVGSVIVYNEETEEWEIDKNGGYVKMKFNFDNELNKGVKRFDYEITDKHEYRKLEELYNENKEGVHIVRMFYTNKKSMYGDNEVVVTDDYIINLPKHLTKTVEKIVKDDKYLELINQGKFAFNVYEYEYNEGKKSYSVNWGILPSRHEHR